MANNSLFVQLKTKLGEHFLVDYKALDAAQSIGDYSSFEPYLCALGLEFEMENYLERMSYGT